MNPCTGATSGGGTGTTNTGSGGGGGFSQNPNTTSGGNGGSGLVIISYANTFRDATSVTNGTKTTSGGNTIYTFLTSGSITF
jgi:hypothetical protein